VLRHLSGEGFVGCRHQRLCQRGAVGVAYGAPCIELQTWFVDDGLGIAYALVSLRVDDALATLAVYGSEVSACGGLPASEA
jgi:hypothetical protein